jgi:hypothetical protein
MKKEIIYSENSDTDNKLGALVTFVAFLIVFYWMQEAILSFSTQILIIVVNVFVFHRAQLKIKEISQWIHPSIYSIPPFKISNLVRWNLFALSPLLNRYKIEVEKRSILESRVKNSKKEIKKISDTINDLNNKISRCQANNPEKTLSLASKTEINVLLEKISNEIKRRDEVEAKRSKLEMEIKKKDKQLYQLREDARVIILKSKKGHNKKYEEEVEVAEEQRKIMTLIKPPEDTEGNK